MPDLPTITLTQEQQDRVLPALQEYFGTTTPALTATAYKKWVVEQLRDIVFSYESKAIEAQMLSIRNQKESLRQSIDDSIK